MKRDNQKEQNKKAQNVRKERMIAERQDESARAIVKLHVSDIVIVLVLTLLSITCLFPFIHVFAKSISENSYVTAKEVFLIPKGLTLAAYRSIFQDGSLTRSMIYSVGVTLLFTLLGMIACICAAYPLSKKRLKGKAFFTFILMVPMYFNAGLLPTYLLYKDLKLINNMWVLILPLIYSAYNMLIMKNYFISNIPEELEESAFLDGASNIQ
ncbi:MAG: carbohydrate ABC transporter permease, partial [Lachnospiraceae bacterium]|nr:carbohydrate ABC transporter permease [Lachnospiraceae bacterium]